MYQIVVTHEFLLYNFIKVLATLCLYKLMNFIFVFTLLLFFTQGVLSLVHYYQIQYLEIHSLLEIQLCLVRIKKTNVRNQLVENPFIQKTLLKKRLTIENKRLQQNKLENIELPLLQDRINSKQRKKNYNRRLAEIKC